MYRRIFVQLGRTDGAGCVERMAGEAVMTFDRYRGVHGRRGRDQVFAGRRV